MNNLHKGYWLGASSTGVPSTIRNDLLFHFQLIEIGADISILSEPDVHYCFFYLEGQSQLELLQFALRLCKNLNKKVILIHSGSVSSLVTSGSTYIYSAFNTASKDSAKWAANLSTNLNHDYVDLEFDTGDTIEAIIPTNSPEIDKVVQFINNNLPNAIREEHLAEQCHYSVTYFSKLFRKTMGVSFRDYVVEKRIGMAKQILIEDRKSKIATVAYRCGYKDVSYFSRIFKKKTGLTPAGYRQQY